MRHTNPDRTAYTNATGAAHVLSGSAASALLAADPRERKVTAAQKEANMADLKCAVENCSYNEQHLCSKGDIMVGGQKACCCGETCCEIFTQRREGTDSFKSSVVHPSKTISIDCEAVKCMYNSNYKCHADHVDIKGCGACDCRGTECATFTEK